MVFDTGDLAPASSGGGILLSPLTDLRASFDIRTGALTTFERLTLTARLLDLPAPEALLVPQRLEALTREKHTLAVNELKTGDSVFLVNGSAPLIDTDMTGVELGTALIDRATGMVLKAHVEPSRIAAVLTGKLDGLDVVHFERPTVRLGPVAGSATHIPNILTRPWHVRTLRDACLARDLHLLLCDRLRLDASATTSTTGKVFAADSATVHPSVIFDADHGSIFIDEHAVIRPGTIIVGPAYIGPHSHVLERTLIKANTAIGPWCKVAGEIGGTIFQGFANKAHDGHLGDSFVGEWANLGAGTTNSNLLNTYAEVICRPLGSPPLRGGSSHSTLSNERTGEQFLGAMIGDHVKTAICTRIMTGAIIGTGTMFAASAPLSGTIPALSWITDGAPAGTKSFAIDKFIDIARTVMARRKLALTDACEAALRALTEPRR
jgi:UDP-N-acetylglucosamine diphosphorylase/glucosamine-1-phosphate N-acetyltransferase